MNTPPQVMIGFPRPGRALKVVLVAILVLGIFNALLATWVPGGEQVFLAMVCDFGRLRQGQLWRILTSGLLTSTDHYSHLLFTLLGFYFLAPDLERLWGDGRLLRFLGLAIIGGNLTVMAVDALVPDFGQGRFHPNAVFGADAALAAIAVAWSQLNADRTVNMFFVLPVRGKYLLWITLGFCVLDLIYPAVIPEGVVAPFGGVAVGLLLGGTPSLVRTAWLRLKLAILRRQAGSLTVDDVLSAKPRRRPRPAGPPLRVVQGGLDEELKKRTPPKDKRYLN